MLVVLNTSVLIALHDIGRLELLKALFTRVLVPKTVSDEYGSPLPEWIEVRKVRNEVLLRALTQELHRGEAEAVVLAIETGADLLVMDDKKARRVARNLGLRVIGTVGLLLLAKERGLLDQVRPLLLELIRKGFWLSQDVVRRALKEAGEA